MEGAGGLVESALPTDIVGRAGGNKGLDNQSIPLKVRNTFIDFEDSFVQDSVEGREAQNGSYWKRGASEPAPTDSPTSPCTDYIDSFGFDIQRLEQQPHRQLQQQLLQMQNPKPGPKSSGNRPSHQQVAEPMHVQAAMLELANSMASLGLEPNVGGAMAPDQDPGMDPTAAMAFDGGLAPPGDWGETTTVMMRNLPNKYTQRMLLEEINAACLGAYDFLYLPIDPETAANRGYAFINFITPSVAWTFKSYYDGRKMNRFNSNKVVSVVPATLQGFEANYAHYASARVNRGDPAARPLFLREPQQGGGAPGGPGGIRSGRRSRGGGGGGIPQAGPPASQAPPQLLWQVAAAMASTAQSMADVNGAAMQQQMMVPETAGQGGMVPRFCPHCGGTIQHSFQFCPQCGASLDFNQA